MKFNENVFLMLNWLNLERKIINFVVNLNNEHKKSLLQSLIVCKKQQSIKKRGRSENVSH